MSENCTHDCGSCSQSCGSRGVQGQKSFIEKPHDMSSIKKVIAVISGKGGVGKSYVTSMLAVLMQRKGYRTAILDADITGPSVPKAFGLTEKATGSDSGLFPVLTKTGIQVMSVNLLLKNETDPVVWRGPVIAGTVKQFWTDVIWNDVDFMFVDMPPGTGDVPLTVFQSIPISGVVVVSTPQTLVSMIVEKAVKMAEMMNVPVLGLVENMSYFKCGDCGREHKIFGESNIEKYALEHDIQCVAKLPIDPEIAKLFDKGLIELSEAGYLDSFSGFIENELK